MAKKRDRYVVGPDLDLDGEDFQYHGERLTNERADQIADETLAEARARGLLSRDPARPSSRVRFAVSQPLYDEASRVAAAEGLTLSALARRAFDEYVRSRAS
jgi:hypothetical protein